MKIRNVANMVFRTCGTEVLDPNKVYKNTVETYLNKPENGSGLFASPCGDNWYTWSDWCSREDYNVKALKKWVDFRVDPRAKILIVQTDEDVKRLPMRPGFMYDEVDFNKVFSSYDGIFVSYSELCSSQDELTQDFIMAYDCDTLFMRKLKIL